MNKVNYIVYGNNEEAKERFFNKIKKENGEYRFFQSGDIPLAMQDVIVARKNFYRVEDFENWIIFCRDLFEIPISLRLKSKLELFHDNRKLLTILNRKRDLDLWNMFFARFIRKNN